MTESGYEVFVQSYFNKRVCSKFIKGSNWKEDSSNAVVRCQCGQNLHSHPGNEQFVNDAKEEWQPELHTKPEATDAFGTIDFIDCNQKFHQAKDHWGLRKPNLVISVTGGAKRFKLDVKLREVFQRGLMKAAQLANAYIISGGSNVGVMKYVGQTVRESSLIRIGSGRESLVAIGIVTWGIILGRHDLIRKGNRTRYKRYKADPDIDERGALLEPNHTHFILVDDGSVGKYGVEIELRSKLEQAISAQKMHAYTTSDDLAFQIPIVCVVLEGGPNTIATLYAAIEQRTPGVVVANSGRAANILSFAYSHIKCDKQNESEENYYIQPEYENEVTDMIYSEFGWKKEINEKKCIECLEQVKQCLKKKSMITIYRAEEGELDQAILHALMKANPLSKKAQLNLALTWNKLEVAKNQIFSGKKWQSKSLESAMMTALKNNNVEFVKLLIERGLKVDQFLTKKRLQELYSSISNHSILNILLQRHTHGHRRDDSTILHKVGRVISHFMGSSFPNFYSGKEEQNEQTPDELDNSEEHVIMYNSDSSDEEGLFENSHFEDPFQHLFLWSILRNRSRMAFYMWQKARNPIAAALFAYKLFIRMNAFASKTATTDTSSELLQNATDFQFLAIGVMNECYQINEENTILLLRITLPRWNNLSCISLAGYAKSEYFISHACCQKILDDVWNDNISSDNSSWKIVISSCLPMLVACSQFIKFSEDNVTRNKLTEAQETSTYKIDSDIELRAVQDNNTVGTSGSENQTVAFRFRNCCNSQRVFKFYAAPRTKFIVNSISFFCYIFLYAYVILSDFQSPYPGVAEYILIVWTLSLITEEIRQLLQSETTVVSEKLLGYLSDLWNVADAMILTVIMAAVVLRFFPQTREVGRIIYCLGFLMYCLRLLQIFSASIYFGPLLVMIKKMLKDLVFFVIVLGVFLIAYGVSSQAILHPNHPFNLAIIKKIFFIPYYQIYGELFLTEVQGEDCPEGATFATDPNRCVANEWLVPILLSGYMLVTNILLINLLIAMFNNTYTQIQERSDRVWKFQRCDLIREYRERPILPPPLILISHILLLINKFRKRYIVRHTSSLTFSMDDITNRTSLNVSKLNYLNQQELEFWECQVANAYLMQSESETLINIKSRIGLQKSNSYG